MHVCVVSFKECWEESGTWMSYGGFPLQMAAIASLFDRMTLVIVRGRRRPGGIPLPAQATVVPLRSPRGTDFARKVSVAFYLPYYVTAIQREIAKADVVHTPVPGDIPLISLMLAAINRKPLVVRYGSSWEQTSETTLMNRLTKTLMRTLAGGSNVMLATGAGDREPSHNVHWLFATAISRAEVDACRPRLDREPGRPLLFAYVGRLSPEKGVRFLVEAFGALCRRGEGAPDARLILIGDGPERRELEILVERLECRDAVTFEGQLGRHALLEALQRVDVCVLPSLTESFCKARLDAMLCGVPVITTPVGFGREIVGDGERGWIVPAANSDALTQLIERILDQPPDWPALRRRCRAYVESRTLEVWASRIAEICSAQWNLRLVEGKLRA
jgi:glycosyltransferase involved in cell wall biosynthesis